MDTTRENNGVFDPANFWAQIRDIRIGTSIAAKWEIFKQRYSAPENKELTLLYLIVYIFSALLGLGTFTLISWGIGTAPLSLEEKLTAIFAVGFCIFTFFLITGVVLGLSHGEEILKRLGSQDLLTRAQLKESVWLEDVINFILEFSKEKDKNSLNFSEEKANFFINYIRQALPELTIGQLEDIKTLLTLGADDIKELQEYLLEEQTTVNDNNSTQSRKKFCCC